MAGGRQVIRLGYYTASSALATLRAGDTRLAIRFAAGVHYLYAVVDGPVYRVDLDGEPGSAVCVTGLEIGAPVPG